MVYFRNHTCADAIVIFYQFQLANRSSNQSCTWGMMLNKIHLIRPGCLWPSIALTVQNRGLKHQSFHFHFFLNIALISPAAIIFCLFQIPPSTQCTPRYPSVFTMLIQHLLLGKYRRVALHMQSATSRLEHRK